MIKVYMLPVERIENTDKVKGIEYIHDAILEGMEKPDVKKLIMDTTVEEDVALTEVAVKVRAPTTEEKLSFATLPPPSPPPRDLLAELDALKAEVEKLRRQ